MCERELPSCSPRKGGVKQYLVKQGLEEPLHPSCEGSNMSGRTKCGHLEVKTFLLVSPILSL